MSLSRVPSTFTAQFYIYIFPRKEASPSTFIEVIFDDDSDDQDEFDRNDNNRSTYVKEFT